MKAVPDFSPLCQSFFSKRLITQRRASPHTIAAYAQTFRLLATYAEKQLRTPPAQLSLAQLDAPFLAAFLDHLETNRSNSARSRNARLASLRAFYHYAALEAPQHAGVIQRVLAIPYKRLTRRLVGYLTRSEVEALLGSIDKTTWVGRRNHALLLVAVQTGLRLSELTGLRQKDVMLGHGAYVRCEGKGRNYAKVEVMRRCRAGFYSGSILSLSFAGGWVSRKAGEICGKTGCFRFRPREASLPECCRSWPHGGQPPWHNSPGVRLGFGGARVHGQRHPPSPLGG